MRQCWGSSRMPAPCRRASGQSLGPGFAADPCPPGPPLTTALAEVGRRKTSGGLGGRLRGIPVADGRGGGTGAGPTRWRTRIHCSRPPVFPSVGAVPRRSPRRVSREEVSDLSERAVVVTARGALGGAGGGPGRQHDGDAAARGARDEGAPPHRAPHPRALSRPVPPPPRPPGRAGVGGARGFQRPNRGTTSGLARASPPGGCSPPPGPVPAERHRPTRAPRPPNAAETERSSPAPPPPRPGALGLTRSPPSAASRCWTCR